MNQEHYRTVRALLTVCVCCLIASCGGNRNAKDTSRYTENRAELENRLRAIIKGRPGGKGYAIVVLIRDFGGEQATAESLIAGLSAAVYDYISIYGYDKKSRKHDLS